MSNKENPKILLVDDKPENLKALIRILEDFDVDLVTAASGNEALTETLRLEFALVLMDVQMPGMDGYETAEIMRSRIDTPIIFTTAFSRDQQNVARGYESGAVDYLVKPINPYILKSKVQVFLTLFEQKQSLAEKNEQLHKEIRQRQSIEYQLRRARDTLEETVEERTRELRATYDELREREEQIRLVIDNIPAMVAFVDRDRNYLYTNRQYAEFVGGGRLEGKSLVDALGESLFQQLEPRIESVLAGNAVQFERELSVSGLGPRIVVAAYIPYIVDGCTVGFFSLIQDITERREAEEKQQRMEAQFRQLKKLKALATLTGGVAHEFNNLLVPIIGFSKMVRNVHEDGTAEADYMDRVIRAAYRAKDIVSQVRLFSQKREMKYDIMDFGTALEESIAAARESLPPAVEVITEIEKKLQPVMGNPKSIQQLVQNLCENACEAMPNGGELRIRLLHCKDSPLYDEKDPECGRDCLHLIFEDSGHGMSPEVQDQMFDPFFTTRDQATHTGLGLSVALGIVEQMDGKIEVESEPDRGTRIVICLPAFASRTGSDAAAEEPVDRKNGISVLMIDEESMMLDLTRQYLETAGYQVTTQDDGIRAMGIFNKNPYHYDVIIADQSMRLMSGLELAEKIRAVRPDIPVVLSTGLIDDEFRNCCADHGISHVIQKPFGEEEISDIIRKALLDYT